MCLFEQKLVIKILCLRASSACKVELRACYQQIELRYNVIHFQHADSRSIALTKAELPQAAVEEHECKNSRFNVYLN